MPGGRPSTDGVYLLDLVVGGRVYRYATEAVSVTDADGYTYQYDEGLLEPGLSFGSLVGVGDASVAVNVQAEGVDWALLVAEGHALDRCPAILRRWYTGLLLERARVVLRGLSASPTYGAQGEPLTVSIVRSMREQSRTIPPVQAVVDETTWPVTVAQAHTVPDNANGATYPLVIGAPGGTEDATPIPCVPVPQAEFRAASLSTSKVIWLGGDAAKVRLRLASWDPPQELDVVPVSSADLLGRPIEYVLPKDSDNDGTYLVGFRDDTTYGGGILWRGDLLRGAGDVIEWVLRTYYDGDVDFGRLGTVRAYLNSWKIDTYINAQVSAWDWLSREVLPLLPVEMREGTYGIYPALLRYDLTERDAVAHLDATAGSGRVTRSSSVSIVGDVVNEIAVDYRPSAESGAKWLTRTVLTGSASYVALDGTSTADTRVIRDRLCTESQRRYDVRPLRIQAGAVWDSTTAGLIATHIAARRAWPRRAVQYVGGPWLDDLEVGSCVTLTDPDLHVSGVATLVGDVTPGPGETAVDLLLLDDPALTERSTS
jgi:hypothetical protein